MPEAQPQPGIFALGTAEHCFVELDLAEGASALDLVAALADLSGPETTISGVSFVVGFRPELWRSVAGGSGRGPTGESEAGESEAGAGEPGAGEAGAGEPGAGEPGAGEPGAVRSFEEIAGPDFAMPATQHDAWFWVAGGARDVVFDSAVRVLDAVAPFASVASELGGWLYQHSRDLTGFIDGTENPSMLEAEGVAAAEDGSSVLLYQKWRHLPAWRHLKVQEQERVIGRTKADSVELDEAEMPEDSHVSRNVVEEGGEELAIYRRNVAYGGPTDHGTVFVGFCASQRPLETMLRRMAGVGDGIRDALTRYTEPLSGAYYVVPSVDALRGFVQID